ncbi:uncharacterized protein FFE2_16063 [Fusarium fujikuroi]|nr:uncharacterized protein FFE2_16063 [Fusarium fujikuroi]
MQYSNAA